MSGDIATASRRPEQLYSQIIQRFPVFLVSWIHRFRFRPLDFRHPPRRYSVHSLLNRGRQPVALVDGAGAAPEGSASSAGLRGPRETPPGPTTWVRPATGWWERMNAGESPRNQGRSVWPPLSVSRSAVSRSKENAAVGRREVRRSALWIGSSLPLEGRAMPQGRPMGRRSGPRISALRYPLY